MCSLNLRCVAVYSHSNFTTYGRYNCIYAKFIVPKTTFPMPLQFDENALLQQIAEAQATALVVKDLEHRYLLANQAFADSVGLSIEDIIGKTDLDIGISEDIVLGSKTGEHPGTHALEELALSSVRSDHQNKDLVCCGDESSPGSRTIRVPLVDVKGKVVALLIQSCDSSDIHDLETSLMESVKVRENQLSVLNDFMVKMMADQELDMLMQNITEMITEYTIAENALLFLVGETREYLQAIAGSGTQKKLKIGDRRGPGTGPATLAWTTGKTQYVACTSNYPNLKNFWPENTQLIVEPFIVKGEVIGVAAIGAPQSAGDFRDSTRLIKSLANLAGIAIADARAREFTQLELVRTRALSKLSESISQYTNNPHSGDTDRFMSEVSEATMSAMYISRAYSYLMTKEGEKVISRWNLTENGIEKIPDTEEFIEHGTIGRWCIQNNQFAHIPRNFEDPRLSHYVHERRRKLNLGCTLCMPITSGEKVLGAMMVHRNNDMRDFAENDINIFKSIVNQISAAHHSHDLSIALQFAAYHDSLTQLPNRRLFEDELQNDLTRCKKRYSQGALMFLDLDGFKAVNDTFGHRLGDLLLTDVAGRLKQCLHSRDLLARIGGDEFAVIVPEITHEQQVLDLARRLRDSLASVFEVDGAIVKIGVSIGVSYYPDDGTSADVLLQNADEAMYQAKADGKGRVVCFSQLAADGISEPISGNSVFKRAI